MHFHSTNQAANRNNSNKISLESLTNSSQVRLDTSCTAIPVQVFSLVKYILILLFKNNNSLGFLELIFSVLLFRSLHLRLCCLVSTCTISKTIIAFKEGKSSTEGPEKQSFYSETENCSSINQICYIYTLIDLNIYYIYEPAATIKKMTCHHQKIS